MTAFLLLLLAIAAGLFWWIRYRSAKLRRETESREAQVLEALFAARRSAANDSGGETLDLDKVFGGKAPSGEKAATTDAVLRAAGLQAELIALVKTPPTGDGSLDKMNEPPAATEPATAASARHSTEAVAELETPMKRRPPPAPPAEPSLADESVPVRDLVQVFYEARGYRVVPAGRAARPVELVLRHKTDPLRSYAFAPLTGAVTAETARTMLERAQRIDQSRVLIASETPVAANLAESLLGDGVRVLDSAAIEAQLAQLDFATAAKIRAVARKRRAQRAQAAFN